LPGGEIESRALDRTRLGMVTAFLFIAGGLYWMASVELLTFSALTAYPTVIWAGAIILLSTMVYAGFWTFGSEQPCRSDRTSAGRMSSYDSVTGLPTNRLFTSLLNQALARALSQGRQVAILMIELDHFILTAELAGEVNCNLIYRVQAARVKSALRTTDTVARLGERTFVALLDHVMAVDEVIAIAKKMQATISMPFTLDGRELFLSSRIGISLSASDGIEGSALLETAAQAVMTARAEGYVIYGFTVRSSPRASIPRQSSPHKRFISDTGVTP
jgi:diguanylate cyclase (GGDEF)-like protein